MTEDIETVDDFGEPYSPFPAICQDLWDDLHAAYPEMDEIGTMVFRPESLLEIEKRYRDDNWPILFIMSMSKFFENCLPLGQWRAIDGYITSVMELEECLLGLGWKLNYHFTYQTDKGFMTEGMTYERI